MDGLLFSFVRMITKAFHTSFWYTPIMGVGSLM